MEESISASTSTSSGKQQRKRKVPSAKELISHYEAQGLNSEEASIKVIEDLQNALFRVISSGNRGNQKKDNNILLQISNKIDYANNRLAILDFKLDSKPSYPHTFAIALASASVFNALTHIWTSATNFTKHSSS